MNIQALNAPGDLFLGSDPATARALGPRHFRSAAKAVRFAMEQAAPVSLRGASLHIGTQVLPAGAIRRLHRQLTRLGQARPLPRPGGAAKACVMTTLADFTLPLLDGTAKPLSDYAGQVVLVVNTASKCGLTPQYEGLEQLYRDHADAGLVVLGFPCNQFAGQEPGSATEIADFCSLTYDVTFPIFAKVEVNGPGETPLYTWLKASAPGILGTEAIKWNFTKFLVGRDGAVVERFGPETEPAAIAPAIARLL